MPKSSKKAGPQNGRQLGQQSGQSDFTLAQFADADPAVVGTGRMKKGSVHPTEQKLIVEAKDKENFAWDEKDLLDFELISGPEGLDEKVVDKEGSTLVKAKRSGWRNHGSPGCDMCAAVDPEGIEYPLDIWFLIGDWVAPEAVATFSAVCQASHMVVHTARFWKTLYKRHYNPDVDLPHKLTPRYMEKVHGLRSRIVRSLFFLYTPFVARVKALVPFEQQVDTLEGQLCTLMWYQKVKNTWHFFYRFKQCGRNLQCVLTQPNYHDKFWKFVPDIFNNEEEDSSVLQVVMTDFIPLPVTMGYKLRKAAISVGHAMRYHKLRLTFTQGNVLTERMSNDNGVVVVMDPVIRVRVLRWWNPAYPGNGPQQLTSPT